MSFHVSVCIHADTEIRLSMQLRCSDRTGTPQTRTQHRGIEQNRTSSDNTVWQYRNTHKIQHGTKRAQHARGRIVRIFLHHLHNARGLDPPCQKVSPKTASEEVKMNLEGAAPGKDGLR